MSNNGQSDQKEKVIDESEDKSEDIYESEEVLEIEEIVKEEINLDKMKSIMLEIERTSKNKDRASLLDKLAPYVSISDVKNFLIEIAKDDKYPLCRAKAISFLSELINEKEIMELTIRKLDDSSSKVRLWAIWSLRILVAEEEIQETLIRHLIHKEKSRTLKLWIIRALSDMIEKDRIIEVFLQILKLKPNKEIRKLLLFYLLQKLNHPEVVYYLTTYSSKETDKEIRRELVRALIELDNDDARYALDKIERNEKDKEINALLASRL